MQLIALNGIAAGGKDTILNELSKYPNYKRIVNCTTRKPRFGEKDNVDYYFISNHQHVFNIEKHKYITYNNSNHGRDYGTLLSEFDFSNDLMGIGHFGENDLINLMHSSYIDYMEVVFIVVDFSTWIERMKVRLASGFISTSEMRLRAKDAIGEIEFELDFYMKYKKNSRFLNNYDLNRSIEFIRNKTFSSDIEIAYSLLKDMKIFVNNV